MKRIITVILTLILACTPVFWAAAEGETLVVEGVCYSADMTKLLYITELYEGDGSIEIPSEVEEICDGAFIDCKKIKDITLSPALKRIGKDAFMNSTVEFITFSPAVELEQIGQCAFLGCTMLGVAELPDSLKILGDNAFKGCTALSTVKVSDLTDVAVTAFVDCTALQLVLISDEEGARIRCSPGDVIGDGNGVNAADARHILRIAARLEMQMAHHIFTADINRDSIITASDARIALRMAAKLQ